MLIQEFFFFFFRVVGRGECLVSVMLVYLPFDIGVMFSRPGFILRSAVTDLSQIFLRICPRDLEEFDFRVCFTITINIEHPF